MKILGIGNAIVDVICKVDDEFIKKNNLTKSTMKLIFEEVGKVTEEMKSKMPSGGMPSVSGMGATLLSASPFGKKKEEA